MKKLICVALFCVCTALTACGNDAKFDGYVADDGNVTVFDNTNVSVEVAPTPAPTPTFPPTVTPEPTAVPVFVDDGTVYTLTISDVEYTGTITEIIAQLPVSESGTYHLHVPLICDITTDVYGLPKNLLYIAEQVASLNDSEEYKGYTPSLYDAKEFLESLRNYGFNATKYEVIAAYHKTTEPSPSDYKVKHCVYLDLESNTYMYINNSAYYFDTGATSVEEVYAWCETRETDPNDDYYHWTYFK